MPSDSHQELPPATEKLIRAEHGLFLLLIFGVFLSQDGRPAYASLLALSIGALGLAVSFCSARPSKSGSHELHVPAGYSTPQVWLGALSIWSFSLFLGLRIVRGLSDSGAVDRFESSQATLLGTICLVALLVGKQMGRRGREALAGTAILLTAFVGPLLLVAPQGFLVTGNTGYDAQVLLPGFCLALFFLVLGLNSHSFLYWIAAISAAAFAITTPVVGVAAVIAGWTVLASFAPSDQHNPSSRKRTRGVVRLSAGLLLLALSFSIGGSQTNPVDAPIGVVTPVEAQDHLGGVNVRTLIWGTIPALIKDYPGGVGTGQFQALYPPYRDLREIELSSHQRETAEIQEVEHPHNDLLFAFAEQGFLGGALFGLGWICAGLALLASVFQKSLDRTRRGLAFATLALLGVSLFHAPLLSNHLAGPLAFLLLGACLPSSASSRAPSTSRTYAIPLLVVTALLLGQLPKGYTLMQHERALFGTAKDSVLSPESIVTRCPSSFEANSAMAGAFADSAPFWEAALEARPHSIEALTNLGGLLASHGDLDGALTHWSHVRALDPGYPVIQRNLQRLGADFILTGQLDKGLPELSPELAERVAAAPTELPLDAGSYLHSAGTSEQDPLLARAYSCAAQWIWARESVNNGAMDEALRLFRQARRETAKEPKRTNPALEFEYAAALFLEGRKDEAIALWDTLPSPLPQGSVAPAWATEAFSQQ